jgi:hypothetical protein
MILYQIYKLLHAHDFFMKLMSLQISYTIQPQIINMDIYWPNFCYFCQIFLDCLPDDVNQWLETMRESRSKYCNLKSMVCLLLSCRTRKPCRLVADWPLQTTAKLPWPARLLSYSATCLTVSCKNAFSKTNYELKL